MNENTSKWELMLTPDWVMLNENKMMPITKARSTVNGYVETTLVQLFIQEDALPIKYNIKTGVTRRVLKYMWSEKRQLLLAVLWESI